VVCTGRGDFPNQLNNSLGFPGIFRGVLDVRARVITDGMAIAAAEALAEFAATRGMDEESILPRMDEWESQVRVAVAAAMKAQEEGVARVEKSREELTESARHAILEVRQCTDVLQREGLIAAPPLAEDET